ncbi:MAG: patatin-like phospholipase family protein [Calditerrivibrio sp.]|nr:patatin-like phospholipase family protein [Calditerrivibrio sp.]
MKIGLALGSGAARGLAHIGLLKAFDEKGIRPYAITGSSMGALIGGLYAAGFPVVRMEEFANNLDYHIFKRFVDIKISSAGLIAGEKIERLLSMVLKKRRFEELDIPFKCVSTDLLTGIEVVFDQGDLIKAIRASISFPVVFVPVYYEKMFLVDGGIKNPVPVDLLPDECDVKFAVNVGPFVIKEQLVKKYYIKNDPSVENGNDSLIEKFYSIITEQFKELLLDKNVKYPNILETVIQTIAILQQNAYNNKLKEVRGEVVEVMPDLDDFKLTDFKKGDEIIKIGYEAGCKILKDYLRC